LKRPVGSPARARNGIRDLRGAARLALEATRGVTDVVESMHRTIARVPGLPAAPGERTTGITGLVYRSVRGVTGLVGAALDSLLAAGEPLAGDRPAPLWHDNALAVVNGVLGDHLEASGNPLAIRLELRHQGRPLVLERAALAGAVPQASGHLLVLIHGLCMNERQFRRNGHDHGEALAAATGCTPVQVRYNTGRHVSDNGRDLAAALEALVREWPVPLTGLTLLGHSMGGLVARSAVHCARQSGQPWPGVLRRLFFLGTPHHGAPLERGGHWIDRLLEASPYTAALARVGRIRSAGITDLRHGSVLEADWRGRDRFAGAPSHHGHLPLPAGVRCHALAATLSPSSSRTAAVPRRLRGDGLVPVRSALGQHADPARCLAFAPQDQWVGHGLGHLDLLDSPQVCARLIAWMRQDEPALR
jgi:hypothetical protein